MPKQTGYQVNMVQAAYSKQGGVTNGSFISAPRAPTQIKGQVMHSLASDASPLPTLGFTAISSATGCTRPLEQQKPA